MCKNIDKKNAKTPQTSTPRAGSNQNEPSAPAHFLGGGRRPPSILVTSAPGCRGLRVFAFFLSMFFHISGLEVWNFDGPLPSAAPGRRGWSFFWLFFLHFPTRGVEVRAPCAIFPAGVSRSDALWLFFPQSPSCRCRTPARRGHFAGLVRRDPGLGRIFSAFSPRPLRLFFLYFFSIFRFRQIYSF